MVCIRAANDILGSVIKCVINCVFLTLNNVKISLLARSVKKW